MFTDSNPFYLRAKCRAHVSIDLIEPEMDVSMGQITEYDVSSTDLDDSMQSTRYKNSQLGVVNVSRTARCQRQWSVWIFPCIFHELYWLTAILVVVRISLKRRSRNIIESTKLIPKITLATYLQFVDRQGHPTDRQRRHFIIPDQQQQKIDQQRQQKRSKNAPNQHQQCQECIDRLEWLEQQLHSSNERIAALEKKRKSNPRSERRPKNSSMMKRREEAQHNIMLFMLQKWMRMQMMITSSCKVADLVICHQKIRATQAS